MERLVVEVQISKAQPISMAATLNEFERRMIIEALNQSGGSRAEAARMLLLNRTTLVEKMKRFGIK